MNALTDQLIALGMWIALLLSPVMFINSYRKYKLLPTEKRSERRKLMVLVTIAALMDIMFVLQLSHVIPA